MPTRPIISYHASLAGCVGIGWRASLQVAHDAGFAAIDVVLPDAAHAAQMPAGVRAGPASLPVEFRLDDGRFARDFAALSDLAALAARLGVQTMYRSIPASSDIPAGELRPILQRRVSLCASILEQHGIDFAVEVLGPLHRRREASHEFIWTLRQGAEFASSCGPGVGVLLDSWHWHHAAGTTQEINEVAGLIRHVHVADAPDLPATSIRDDQRLLPGQGVVSFEEFFGALADAGYSGMISPEIRGYRCGSDPVSCAVAARDAVEGEIDRYFRG